MCYGLDDPLRRRTSGVTSMGRSREESFDPTQPTLIVKYGTTKKKYRPLRRDLVVLGRGPACDIGLVSPEVAPVHCVLVRLPTGWMIRDCSGRATRVNGQAITEEPLRDGDTITVGTFSFEAHLPAESAGQPAGQPAARAPAVVPARFHHLEKSRRRFAERAMRLRARVRDLEKDDADRTRQHEELARMEEVLRASRADLEKRRRELDSYARHIKRERQQMRDLAHEQEADTVRQRVDLDDDRRRVQQMQAEMQARMSDLESVTETLEAERESLRAQQEQVQRERDYIDQQRKDLMRQRQVEAARETVFDTPPDRIESARRVLQTMKMRRGQLKDQ
jgi:hypothetical protein